MKSALLNMGLGDMFNLATADFTRITSKSTTHMNVNLLRENCLGLNDKLK